MFGKIAYFVIIFCGIVSCNEEQRKQHSNHQLDTIKPNVDSINKKITQMIDNDQFYRHLVSFGTGDSAKLDSIYNQYAGQDLDSLMFTNPYTFTNAKFQDSVDNIIKRNDIENCKNLICILTKYGFPSEKLFDSHNIVSPDLIIQHTPSQYLDTMNKLFDLEFKLGHIDSFEYKVLKWHLSGRPDSFDFPEGLQVIKMKR